MSGYFLGPPLMVHVLVVAGTLAVVVPYLAGGSYSRLQIVLIALGIAVVYGVLAIVWGSRHVILRRRPQNSNAGRDADRKEPGGE